jgi:hypothetical protein
MQVADVRRRLEVASRGASCANAAGIIALAITALVGFFNKDLIRRTSASAACVASRTASAPSSAPPIGVTVSAPVGHVAVCTEPGCHHDQTSSVTNGRIRREQSQQAESATSIALLADAAASRRSRRSAAPSPARDSRRRTPRRTPRALQHAGVVVGLELFRRFIDQPR